MTALGEKVRCSKMIRKIAAVEKSVKGIAMEFKKPQKKTNNNNKKDRVWAGMIRRCNTPPTLPFPNPSSES